MENTLPERALSDMQFNIKLGLKDSGFTGETKISIILNQIIVKIITHEKSDIIFLRRIVKSMLENEMAKLAFIRGFNYSVVIERGIDEETEENFVFGSDYPLRNIAVTQEDIDKKLTFLRKKKIGKVEF
ncbi:hypothetical protein [Rahnella sp. GSA61A]|uniref:hypothetical protein n=1 Tax=Rahnella sp. GSA61A TaxID=2862678 RepID=UPI001CBD77A5|nr:hypothetical protein [Rahnella sp. GSA61A]